MFRRRRWFQGRPIHGSGRDATSPGSRPTAAEMTDERLGRRASPSRWACSSTATAIAEHRPARRARSSTTASCMLFNAHHEPLDFTLPAGDVGRALGRRARHRRPPMPSTSADGAGDGRRSATEPVRRTVAACVRCSRAAARAERRRRAPPTACSCTPGFGFDDAAARRRLPGRARRQPPLLARPYLQAAPGSTHGYDVVDHRRVNDELGGGRGPRRACARRSARHGLGQVLDIVPNHMAIVTPGEPLVVGRARERPVQPLRRLLRRRLGPARGQAAQHGAAARARRPLRPGARGGRAHARAARAARFTRPLPRARAARWRPARSTTLLAAAAGALRLRRAGLPRRRLRRACRRPPRRTARAVRRAPPRQGGAAAAARRGCCDEQPERGRGRRRRGRRAINADPDAPRRAARAPELPAGLLAHGRPASSTTAASSTSTRLVGLRVEDERVFDDTHALVLRLAGRRAWSTACASTTPTACATPRRYLAPAARARRPTAWIVVEKILEPGERLPDAWPVDGTTGYDFLQPGRRAVRRPRGRGAADRRSTREFTGEPADFGDVVARTRSARCCARCWAADVNRLTALLSERLRAPPPLPRLHPPRAARGAARGDRLLPGLPHLRARRREPAADDDVAHVDAGRRPRPSARRPDLDPELFDFLARRAAAATCAGPREAELVAALPAADRAGDGQGRRGHRLLPLQPPGRAQRGGRRPGPLRRVASTSSTRPARRRSARWPRDACWPRRPTTPSAARTCGPGSPCCPRSPSAGRRRSQRWSARNERHRARRLARPQRRVPALPDAGRRLAARRRPGAWRYMREGRRARPRRTRPGSTPTPAYDDGAARASSRACSATREFLRRPGRRSWRRWSRRAG